MTSFFVVPSFSPVLLEQLPAEPDDVTIICRQEALITQEVGERVCCGLLLLCSGARWMT